MNDRQLSREVDAATNCISSLVSKVEELESTLEDKEVEIDKLNGRIEELEEQLNAVKDL